MSFLMALGTLTSLDFSAGGAVVVELVVNFATIGVAEATAGAVVVLLAVEAVVDVIATDVVEAPAGAAVVLLAVEAMVEVVVTNVVEATAGAAVATAAMLAPWLKFADRSLKSAAFTKPS
jgi:hypothetical protein